MITIQSVFYFSVLTLLGQVTGTGSQYYQRLIAWKPKLTCSNSRNLAS